MSQQRAFSNRLSLACQAAKRASVASTEASDQYNTDSQFDLTLV